MIPLLKTKFALPILLAIFALSTIINAAAPLRVVMFYSTTCGHCRESLDALEKCKDQFKQKINPEFCKTDDLEQFKLMLEYEDHYNSNEENSPKVFVGASYLVDDDITFDRLAKIIDLELQKNSITFNPEYCDSPAADDSSSHNQPENKIETHFKSFSVSTVALAGLADGVNPCAFTTIVFLLSMLSFTGKTGKQLAIVALGFTIAVFTTYLMLGLGVLSILNSIKSFSVGHGIAKVLSYMIGGIAIIFAVWSLIDYFRYKKTSDTKTLTLGLPQSIKQRIHKVIRTGLKTHHLLIGSITIGFMVSLLESLCTGQVYLPTIVFVAQSPELRIDAIAYLVLYNIMFIIPLIIILALSYFGVTSTYLGSLLRKNILNLKLIMAAVFFILGFLIFFF